MPTASFNLHFSYRLLFSLYFFYTVFILSLFFAGIPQISLFFISLICLYSLLLISREQKKWKSLCWHEKAGWKLVDNEGRFYTVKLLPYSSCGQAWIVLNFLGTEKKFSLVILQSAMLKKEFKRLKLYVLNEKRR